MVIRSIWGYICYTAVGYIITSSQRTLIKKKKKKEDKYAFRYVKVQPTVSVGGHF